MHWLSVLSGFVASSWAICLAKPIAPRWDDMRAKHSWGTIPNKWEYHGHPPDGAVIDLHVALVPHRENALIDALVEVSDPRHPKYGAHLSKEQVAELVAPHPDTIKLVGSWLEHHEMPSSSVSFTHGGGWLTLSGVPVAQADALLGASYQLYRHTETNETVLRTIGYSLPAVLHKHVETVAPTTYFGSPKAFRQTSHVVANGQTLPEGDAKLQNVSAAVPGASVPVPSSCANTITPHCLQQLYRTEGYVPVATQKNRLGITGYLGEFASQSDLTVFMTLFRPDAVSARFEDVSVNNGVNDQSHPGTEANLDVQYAGSLSYPTPNIYYITGGSPPFVHDTATPTDTNEPYLDWVKFILNQQIIPQTISTSYGDDEQTVPPDYAKSVCDLFAQLGARGASLLFSSGDNGVGAEDCLSNDGNNRRQFIPVFPASCPFVTTVGGTTGVNPEVAASFSGGGFSNYFERPQYQDATVSAYLNGLGVTNQGFYNRSGRAYPDISAQAENFQVVVSGVVQNVAGTSCSAPTVAGVVSLLNDFRISQGKPPLGFLNYWIYSNGLTGFNDITSGSNPSCNTQGFSAVPGWDPVTGFGTPDFLKLKALL